MIVLHHLERSRSQRIGWLLEELGLEHEVRGYARDAKTGLGPPALASLHPLGKSPMVEIDGRLVTESGAIVELLCATHAPAMIPATGSQAHIEHLEWMHFAEGSAMTPILLNLYIGRLGEAGAPLRPRIHQQLDAHFSFMEQGLRDSGHFVLDTLSAADIMLSFPAEVGMRAGGDARYPRLSAFVAANHARPAWQRAKERGDAAVAASA